ncbi:hypothetical protein [Leeuwenhoekiella sp. ZYFB001]|uniref:hypothetical protein n=1 Tax=Leeuwenhoekiella sp. ZYFB001 TaxID=2719912 RepID=UPI00143192C2|nr:hypothetical protein [Leeuwenhoekiella sp. ZYFB001]
MANSPYITPAQVDEKVQAALSKGISASAKGFKLFTNPAAKDAFFNGTPPAEDTPFIYTDAGESKAEFYQRASDNTTQVLKEAGLTAADISQSEPIENSSELATSGQLYDVKKATDQKFKQVDVTTQVEPDADNSKYKIFSFGSSGGYSRINSWYFGKSGKPIKSIGIFICRATRLAASTAGLRVQLVIKKASGGSESRVLDYTIPQTEIDENYTFDTEPSDKSVCERIIDLDTPITLEDGDQLFCNQSSPDRYLPIYYEGDNLANESGEWNNGAGNYSRQWYGSYVNANYTTVPSAPSEPNPNVLHFYDAQESEIILSDLNKKVEESLPDLEDISSIVTIPTVVRGLNYDDRTLNFTARIPVEGIFTQALKSARVNGSASAVIDFQTNTDGTTNVSLTLSADNYKTETFTIPFRHSPLSSLQNVMIKLTSIGDSLTQGQVNGSNGNKIAYSVIIDFLVQALNADIGNVALVNVGTMLGIDTLTQFDRTYTVRACNEGRGGWAISDYLRKFTNTRRQNGSNTPYRIVGKAAWDSLGLGTMTRNGTPGRTYVGFSNTTATGDLMRLACHGYYEADPTEELWDWIVNVNGVTSFTYDSVTYTFGGTYSSADDEAQKAYILYRCTTDVDNPFFDLDTVESSGGSYAFNYTEYLNKYKTLASDGVTRLVVGSTAGTLVTDVNEYDVCEPTHASIIMTENDVNNISDGSLVIPDVILMGERIHAHNSSIKILMGTNRGYGVFNSGLYSQQGYIKETTVNSYRLAAYQALKAELEINTDFDELPLYAIQSPKGTAGAKSYDTFDLDKLDRWNGDGLHAGDIWGYFDRAYQILAWIASTL